MLASKERATDLERLAPLIEAGMVTPSLDASRAVGLALSSADVPRSRTDIVRNRP